LIEHCGEDGRVSGEVLLADVYFLFFNDQCDFVHSDPRRSEIEFRSFQYAGDTVHTDLCFPNHSRHVD
ncbi:hypothetical protein PFISCL1PPCAC_21436, partial [Pristionchus fissidentatus]